MIFNFYYLNMNISLDIIRAYTKFSTFIENILMQEKVSQNFHLGLSFNFMTKKRITFVILCLFLQIYVTKQKLRPILKI